MASKTILKKKRQQAVVQIMGTGNATISMQELALADETIDFANVAANVNISALYYSTDSNVIISRNGNTVIQLYGTDNWEMSQSAGFVFNQDNSSNILVNFGAGNGTAVLVLTKQSGYQEPNQQIKV